MPINAQNPIETPPVPSQTYDKWWLRRMELISDQPKAETLIRCELMLYRENSNFPNGAEVCRIDGIPVTRTLEVPLSLLKAAHSESNEVIDQILALVGLVARTMGTIDSPPPEPLANPIPFN